MAGIEDSEPYESERSARTPIYNKETEHVELEGSDSIEVVVWLRDRKGLHLVLQGSGYQAKVSELFKIVKDELKLPDIASKIFSIWMVSPLLELRLKDDHQPFEIAQLWDRFCMEYADAKMDEITRDEPVVMFQRNVFLSLKEEMEYWKSAPEEVLALLYYEAKHNVISGRYLLSDSHYDELAGIQALMEKGPFSRTLESYKDDIKKFYPKHICKPKKLLLRSNSKNNAMAERFRDAHTLAFNSTGDMTKKQLYCQYLEICAKYPFYGCAFFEAILQKPTGNVASVVNRSLSRGFPEREITVTINTEGICLIDYEEKEVLLVVPYEQLSWDLPEERRQERGKLPTLYVQFLVKADKSTRVVQIYSKQATFMDALIETCVNKKQRSFDSSEERNEAFCYGIPNKLEKMCLKKYSLSGQCMDN